MPQSVTLKISRRITAPPERVFDAWLDSKTAGKWLFATPKGQMLHVNIDARIGGKFSILRRDGEDIDHVGEYLEIDPPRRLVFTFGVPKFSAEFTRVTIEIVSLGEGCELALRHENVLPEWAEQTKQGWGMILDGLERHLAR